MGRDRLYLWVATATMATLVSAFLFKVAGDPYSLKWLGPLSIVLTAFVGLYAFYTLRLLERNPQTLTIALLGFPGSGKTVFLTSLFDSLQQSANGSVRFAPYGEETVEEVSRNLNLLSKGVWLPRTKPGHVFFFRANASVGTGLLRRRFKIEIADFAGEDISELDPMDERWLHKGSFFKYVTQSDAVILVLDCGMALECAPHQIDEIQNAFVAAVQILAESKGTIRQEREETPLTLIFTKADLLGSSSEQQEARHNQIVGKFDRLIRVCENRFRHFRYFFVSAVGRVERDGSPPKRPDPTGVIDPLLWILRISRTRSLH